jgi:hypothetical protein
LADAFGNVAAELGGGENDGERQHHRRECVGVGRSSRRLKKW